MSWGVVQEIVLYTRTTAIPLSHISPGTAIHHYMKSGIANAWQEFRESRSEEWEACSSLLSNGSAKINF